MIVDNSDADFAVEGWWGSSTTVSHYYESNYRYTSSGDGSKTATWHFDVTAGSYDIFAWWTAGTNRPPDAPYRIYNNGAELGTHRLDQKKDGGQFNLLGTYALEAGTLEVVLGNDVTTGYVIADAVKVGYH
jgi:hypothetical protein